MAGKARAAAASKPFSKARAAQAPLPESASPPSEAPEPETEAAAEAKVQVALSKKSVDQTSDYVFATPGLDPRMAGRVSSWIQEIEEKDRYVGGHAVKVAELAVAIAREAGLSSEDVDKVRLAGLLHDIGKRACPPEVLQKKDEDLSDPELIIMMKHPIDGADLVESFPDLKHLAEIIRSHHEEFDGNGYPQGLKGEDIPLAARVVGLANSYHSMISDMVYGPGASPEKAGQDLLKGAGKQWDPALVQALLQAIKENKVPVA
jgi:putative nucleotidyltransferase with HDIG domain